MKNDKKQIIMLYHNGMRQCDIADKLNVTRSYVNDVIQIAEHKNKPQRKGRYHYDT